MAAFLLIVAGVVWWSNASTWSTMVSAQDSAATQAGAVTDSSSLDAPVAIHETPNAVSGSSPPRVSQSGREVSSPTGAAASLEVTPSLRTIPRGAIVCAAGPAGTSATGAVERALGEVGVPIATLRVGSCESVTEGLLGRGSLPASIASTPEARAYVAIETEISVQDSTYWMVECSGRVLLALFENGGTRIRQFDLVPIRTGVQPNRQSAVRSVTQQFISQNADVFRQIAEAARSAR